MGTSVVEEVSAESIEKSDSLGSIESEVLAVSVPGVKKAIRLQFNHDAMACDCQCIGNCTCDCDRCTWGG